MRKVVLFCLMVSVLSACDMFFGKKQKIAKKWKVQNVELPKPVEFAVKMGLKMIPGVEEAIKYTPGFLKEKLEDEIRGHYLKSTFEFKKDDTLVFGIAGNDITDASWKMDEKNEGIVINIKDFEMPFTIRELEKEKLTIVYTFEGQDVVFFLVPESAE